MQLTVKYIPLSKILIGANGRGTDLPNVPELANSILAYGVVSPVTVQESKVAGFYDLISGYRRIAALQHIQATGAESNFLNIKDGQIMVPAIPYPESGLKDLELQVLYNQYIEWPLYMRIVAANQLWVEHGYTQSQIANIFGLNRQTVSQYIALAKSPRILAMLGTGELSELSLYTLYEITRLLDGPDCQGDKSCETAVIQALRAIKEEGGALSWNRIENRLRAVLGHIPAGELPPINELGEENIFGGNFGREIPVAELMGDEMEVVAPARPFTMLDSLSQSLDSEDLEDSIISPSNMPINYQKMIMAFKTLGNIHEETDKEIRLVTRVFYAMDKIIRNPAITLSVPEMRVLILNTIGRNLK